MKKYIFIILCVLSTAHAEEKPVVVDVSFENIDLCHVELVPGQSVEIERVFNNESQVVVRYNSILSRIGTSICKTVADSPFFTALAVWALLFNRNSIGDHPIKSMIIGGVLISDFTLQMLHSAEQKINISR